MISNYECGLMYNTNKIPSYILPIIVFAQFAGTSLWFAVNAIATDLQQALGFSEQVTADLTAIVQLGFIIGSFLFALLAIADRFSPVKVFLISSLLASFFNACVFWGASNLSLLLSLRVFIRLG